MAVFWATQRGAYAPLYWTMVICNFVIPFAILSLRQTADDVRPRDRLVSACSSACGSNAS